MKKCKNGHTMVDANVGSQGRCKQCARDYRNSNYVHHPKPKKTLCKFGHSITIDSVSSNGTCKKCHYNLVHKIHMDNPKLDNEKKSRWRRENPKEFHDQQRQQRYGITPAVFYAQLKLQKGRCLACNIKFDTRFNEFGRSTKKQTYPHVDHDHKCCEGKVTCGGKCFRGLLCGWCNSALGNVKDSVTTLLSLAKYLQSNLTST